MNKKPIKIDELQESGEPDQRDLNKIPPQVAAPGPLMVRSADTMSIGGPFSSVHSFTASQRMAQALCSSDIVPQQFQGPQNIGNTLIALECAQNSGMPILSVLQNLHVIHGKPGWSSQYIIACINMSGRFADPLEFHQVGEVDTDSWGMYASALSHSGRIIKGPVVTMRIARAEGWMQKKGSKWQTIPELMLRYRAAAWFGRTVCPELMMGLQSVDELNDKDFIEADYVTVEEVKKTVVKKEKVVEEEPEPELTDTPQTQGNLPDKDAQEVAKQLEEKGFYMAGDEYFNADGEVFNDKLHVREDEGQPKMNKDGSFRARRGKADAVAPTPVQPTATDSGNEDDDYALE